ncbi:MAG TPA: S24 family peptidase, partial [Nitrospira sp.]|nr:S24 family peptidase [Nitrospira sp.]
MPSVPTKRVEIKIQKHLSSFDEHDENLLKHALANFLGISVKSISIIEKKNGSTRVLLSMPTESADRLVDLYRFHREELQKALAVFPLEEVKQSPGGESREVDVNPQIESKVLSRELPPTSYLTELQKEILKYIQDSQQGRGITPTHREISEKFGFSSYGTAYKHLKLLQEKGFLRRDWNQRRGINLIRGLADSEYSDKELPFFGRIAAGRPIQALSGSDRITVPGDLLDHSRGDYYALLVVGESMIDEGILDGDFVIVLRRDSAE